MGKAESPEPVFTTTFNSSPSYFATASISLLPSSFLPQLCFHVMDVTQISTVKATLYSTFKNPKICFVPQPANLYSKKCDLYKVDDPYHQLGIL